MTDPCQIFLNSIRSCPGKLTPSDYGRGPCGSGGLGEYSSLMGAGVIGCWEMVYNPFHICIKTKSSATIRVFFQGSKWTFGKKPEKCVSLLAGHGHHAQRTKTPDKYCFLKTKIFHPRWDEMGTLIVAELKDNQGITIPALYHAWLIPWVVDYSLAFMV